MKTMIYKCNSYSQVIWSLTRSYRNLLPDGIKKNDNTYYICQSFYEKYSHMWKNPILEEKWYQSNT